MGDNLYTNSSEKASFQIPHFYLHDQHMVLHKL